MPEEQSIEIDKKTYAKLKKLADVNECSVNEEIGNAFTATYEDLDDSVFDEISIIEKRDSVLLILPTDLYDSFQEEAENNSTEIEDELNLFFEEHLASSGEEFEDESDEYEEESENDDDDDEESTDEDESDDDSDENEKESENDDDEESTDEDESDDDSDENEEESENDDEDGSIDEDEESQSILIDKKIYIELKKLADANECSINEEIGKAFSATYEDIDDDTIEKIDVMPRKDMVYVLLPKALYDSFQEEADKNSTEIEEELNLFFEDHLAASNEDDEDESEEDESEESEDEDETRAKKTEKSKGFFNLITDAVGEFVEDLINDEEHKKKKKN